MSEKKILLVNPGFVKESQKLRKPIPPFGLLSLTAALQKEGFKVELKDFNFLKINEIIKELKEIITQQLKRAPF